MSRDVPRAGLSTRQLLHALHERGVEMVFFNIDYLCRSGRIRFERDEDGHRVFDPKVVDEILAIRARRSERRGAR